MSRTPREETFAPDEIATVHVMNRVVRRCFLMGIDSFSGKNYDYRKEWLEGQLERVAADSSRPDGDQAPRRSASISPSDAGDRVRAMETSTHINRLTAQAEYVP